MRTHLPVLWRLSAGILVVIAFLIAACPVSADTGTYKIPDYSVVLEPQNDGQVKITITQQWQVLSGDIPWITVGLPNKNFTILDFGNAASRVSAENSGGFTGVRIDLNKDYLPGQSFSVKFTVLQRNLLERLTSENKWRIGYTPGWYDRAVTDHLKIDLISPVDYSTYISISPPASTASGNHVTWERTNLATGARFNITVESTDGSFLTASAPSGSNSKRLGTSFYVTIGVIIAIGLLIFWGVGQYRRRQDAIAKERVAIIEKEMATDKKKREEYEKGFKEYVAEKNIKPDAEGRYYDRSYGDYITPAIWAAVLFHPWAPSVKPTDDRRTGTGGFSCACACVSCACACACACAGGGAAGCSRKTIHECQGCEYLTKQRELVETKESERID